MNESEKQQMMNRRVGSSSQVSRIQHSKVIINDMAQNISSRRRDETFQDERSVEKPIRASCSRRRGKTEIIITKVFEEDCHSLLATEDISGIGMSRRLCSNYLD